MSQRFTFGWPWRWACAVACGFVLAFLCLPILAVIPLSFTAGSFLHYPLPGLSWRWYEALFADDRWRLAFFNSLVVGVSATILATVLGTTAALGMTRLSRGVAGLVTGILIAPMIVPLIVTALGLYFLLSQLGLTATLPGLVLAHTLVACPFVFITVAATLKTLDPQLPRAAATLGAGPLYAFFTVTLPLIMPGVVSGALLAFATSLDEIIVTLFIAGPAQRTLPKQIFDGLRESIDPSITAMATLMVLLAMIMMAGMEIMRRRRERLAAAADGGSLS